MSQVEGRARLANSSVRREPPMILFEQPQDLWIVFIEGSETAGAVYERYNLQVNATAGKTLIFGQLDSHLPHAITPDEPSPAKDGFLPDVTQPAEQRPSDLVDALMNELHNPSWAFRTVEGLADALGTSPDDVENVLAADPTLARWVPARDAQGRQLLTSAKKPPSGRERLISLRAFIAKTTY